MMDDLFADAPAPAGAEIIPPAQAVAMAAAGAPVTQGPEHVAIPVVPGPAVEPQPIDGPGNPSEASTELLCYDRAAPAQPGPETGKISSKKVAAGALAACVSGEFHQHKDPGPKSVPLPSLERVREVLVLHGVLAPDAAADDLAAGLVPALAQLVAEAQAAPAGLPPADRVLCWVMDSELAKFAPTRVRASLAPWAVSNGEPMYPLFVPAAQEAKA